MADLPPDKTIVTYRSFGSAFDAPDASPLAGGRSPFESGGDPAAETALRGELSAALAALEEEARKQGPGMMTAVQNQFASLLQSRMLEEPPPGDPRVLSAPTAPQSAFEVKYDERDILGWVGSVFSWWRRIRPEPWLAPPERPEPVGTGSAMRVAMLADWGTGLYGAPVCAQSIERDPRGFDALLHLGDIYYSGTQSEARTRFLDKWPKRADAVSRACNANHEMYTGGEGYFRVVLPAFKQTSSCFALQNDHWLLVGLDTAYEDHDLAQDQAAWLQRLIDGAGSRKVVLVSHHQPFSLLESQGPKLVAKLGNLLGRRRIFAWSWGHEQR
ncbi:MAG: metallophosphoesterase, partial [Vicinamibacterales bacterium]